MSEITGSSNTTCPRLASGSRRSAESWRSLFSADDRRHRPSRSEKRASNQGKTQPSANTLAEAFGLAFSGSDLWVADSINNRVLDSPLQGAATTQPHDWWVSMNFQYNAPNLIEGREMFFAGGGNSGAAGVVVDQNSKPPHLYIADTFNHRILCFNDLRSVTSSSRADLVLGQSGPTDFYDALINSGTNMLLRPRKPDLSNPSGSPSIPAEIFL